MTEEMYGLVEAFGYDARATCAWFTINAMKSAFLPFDERLAIIDEVIKPEYAALLGEERPDETGSGAAVRP